MGKIFNPMLKKLTSKRFMVVFEISLFSHGFKADSSINKHEPVLGFVFQKRLLM